MKYLLTLKLFSMRTKCAVRITSKRPKFHKRRWKTCIWPKKSHNFRWYMILSNLFCVFIPTPRLGIRKNHILYQIMGDPNYKGKGCLYIQCSSHLNSEKKLRRGKISRISRKIAVHIADLNFMCFFIFLSHAWILTVA